MSVGNFAFGGVQRSYSFPEAGIGRLGNSTSVVQMPSIECEQVCFQAPPGNTGDVYIGTSAAMGTAHAIVLEAGNWSPYFPVDNLDKFFYVSEDAASYEVYSLVR